MSSMWLVIVFVIVWLMSFQSALWLSMTVCGGSSSINGVLMGYVVVVLVFVVGVVVVGCGACCCIGVCGGDTCGGGVGVLLLTQC